MTTEQIVAKKDRREGKGRVIAMSRVIYRISGKDVYYVESETEDQKYYYVMWNPDKEIEWCSCLDHSSRGRKCKHIWSVEYGIRGNVIKEVDHLPKFEKRKDGQVKMQYESDGYDF